MIRALFMTAALALPGMAAALSLELPSGAVSAAQTQAPMTSFQLPIGPYEAGEIPSIWAEGALVQQAWQLPAQGQTTLQILKPLRAQLLEAGYQVVFECADLGCGGFDFRYATLVLPEPAMHVDLGDFRFLSAQRMGETAPEYICLLVSRSDTRGFVQMVRIGPEDSIPPELSTSTKNLPTEDPILSQESEGTMAEQLEEGGRIVLADLNFPTGSAELGTGSFASLNALADYLLAHPERRVVLVGHTDAEGALDSNIALSKRRAQSVAQRLTGDFNVPARQIDAQGVGYLSPLTGNLDADSRARNRRVEAILASTK